MEGAAGAVDSINAWATRVTRNINTTAALGCRGPAGKPGGSGEEKGGWGVIIQSFEYEQSIISKHGPPEVKGKSTESKSK